METAMEAVPKNGISIEDLKAEPSIWYKIHVPIYDLRNYQENPQARERLNTVEDLSYIDKPYFDLVESQQVKACTMDSMSSKSL
ncbi:hypothetical protein V491_01855 [Pseudogymnoascus sp. VKM F-3775]|nr:hypothetical protein V491_01855 [Pseudogymnoascus sp. VKM F-3775]